MYLMSHVIIEVNTIYGECFQNMYNIWGVFSIHSYDMAMNVYIRINIPSS